MWGRFHAVLDLGSIPCGFGFGVDSMRFWIWGRFHAVLDLGSIPCMLMHVKTHAKFDCT
jgi:hypothetical protein